MPTVAAARAAASLTPSPTMATVWSPRCPNRFELVLGGRRTARAFGRHPDLAGDRLHHCRVVARQDLDLPSARRGWLRRMLAVGSQRVARARPPPDLAVDRDHHRTQALDWRAPRRLRRRPRRQRRPASSPTKAGEPTSDPAPSTFAFDPGAGDFADRGRRQCRQALAEAAARARATGWAEWRFDGRYQRLAAHLRPTTESPPADPR